MKDLLVKMLSAIGLVGILIAGLIGLPVVSYGIVFNEDVLIKGPHPWADVTAYGATGNDTTDDLVAFNDAIAALPPSGGLIYVPEGTYYVSNTIEITKNNVKIMGAGWGSTIIKTTSAAADIFYALNKSNIVISDLLLDTAVTKTGGAAINLNFVTFARITGVRIWGQYIGILLQGPDPKEIGGSAINYLTDIDIRKIVPANGVGIVINGGNDQYLTNIVMDLDNCEEPEPSVCPTKQPFAGIRIVKSGATWIHNADILRSGYGLLIDPPSLTVDWLFVMNSAFDSNANAGIRIAPTGTGTARGLNFTGTWTASNSVTGVYIAGNVDGVRFVNHRSFRNNNYGILLDGGKNISINNSDISGNSRASCGTYDGIAVAGSVSQFSIINNRSGWMADPINHNTQRYGIHIMDGTSNNYMVTGNDVTYNVLGGLVDSGKGTNKIVTNNLTGSTANCP